MAKVLEKQIKMEEDLKTNTGFSEAAAGKVQAVDMNDEDMTLLNLKWSSVDQIRNSVGDPAKKLAILRVLNSGLISHKQAHVVPEACELFFDDYLVSHLLIKAPPG